jgi:dimethylargininase
MPERFANAIVRPPADTFADGLTSSTLGPPQYAKALEQHRRYEEALKRCGLRVTSLAPAREFPDSTFVEDVAVLTRASAMLTRPGAESRRGEVDLIREVLSKCFSTIAELVAPATLDGGDVCDADGHYFIGVSARTNEQGANQLARWLAAKGHESTVVDIRPIVSLLHLKSGLAYIGDDTMVATDELSGHPAFRRYRMVPVPSEEAYAANCIRANDRVLLPEGFPIAAAALRGLGFAVETIDVSEFEKMDGGLSCLSLRF